jgi:hypothetical protein
MFNLPTMAVASGALALAVWVFAMARGPRLSWRVGLSVGGGLVLMYMWWPAGGDSRAAIALMWLGVALVLYSTAWALAMWRFPGQDPGS